jgi:hypothetical protein
MEFRTGGGVRVTVKVRIRGELEFVLWLVLIRFKLVFQVGLGLRSRFKLRFQNGS